MNEKELERKQLLVHLLNAVKQCQLKFTGKNLLATEKDENIKLLCSSFENVFEHGLKEFAVVSQSSLKQFTDVTGLSKLTSILLPPENSKDNQKSTFWIVLREHLSRHEMERFNSLKNIKTDSGKVKAWFRSALNEHSLEKYLHSVINNGKVLQSSYESWSFMLDDEKAVTLPNLAAGVSTILFALGIDKSELDSPYSNSREVLDVTQDVGSLKINSNVRSKRKKKQAKVIDFDEEGENLSVGGTDSPWDWKFNPDDEFGLTCKASRSSRSTTDDVISPNIPSDSSGMQNSDTFSFEYDQLSYCSPSNKSTESYVPLSKSESNLKDMMGCTKENKISRFGSLFKNETQNNRKSDFLRPVGVDGHVIDVGVFKLIDPDTTSESYGSFDSQDLMDIEVSKAEDDANLLRSSQQATHSSTTDVVIERTDDSSCSYPNKEIMACNVTCEVNINDSTINKKPLIGEERLDELGSEPHELLKEKLKNLERENSLLKEQLRSYISAVRTLEHGNVAASCSKSDTSEIKEYEQKLIQIAEMHAELMEFNSVILKKLSQKEIQLEHAMRELSQLSRSRGPTLAGPKQPNVSIIIPSAFLHGSPPTSYHVYQIYIRVRSDEWNVYRRYTEFYELHCKLKKAFKSIKNLDFPPKRAFRRKDPKLVEERRRKLEDYLKKAIAMVAEKCPQPFENPSRRTLMAAIPFFDNEVRLWNNSGQSTLRLHLSNDNFSQSYSGI